MHDHVPVPKRVRGKGSLGETLPETPHELPFNRPAIDELLALVKDGASVDLLGATIDAVDWSAFSTEAGEPLTALEVEELRSYYREKWADIGPIYLADLLSTEFMTEQRAQGDVVFSDRLIELGQADPELWAEIRMFFRRKEVVTGLLLLAHRDPDSRS